MPRKKEEELIYLKPFSEAVSSGEVELYHASMTKNAECASAIDKAILDIQGRLYLRFRQRSKICYCRLRSGTHKVRHGGTSATVKL